jgi:ribonuclease P protein component
MGKFVFRKEEKLRKEKVIQELFDKGSSFYLFPFKVYYTPNPDQSYSFHQVLISASKRNFKKAVDRNLIKRRMREAYRLQKALIPATPKILLGFVYTHKEIILFDEMKKRMNQCLVKLSKMPLYIEEPSKGE